MKAALVAAALCGCVLLYLHIAGIQSEVNRNMTASDQSANMDFARKAYETGLQYTGIRNQMPLYPWILALFYAPEMTDQEFFGAGKEINVLLSLFLLAGLGVAFFARFSRLFAGYAIISIAFLVFVIRSPFIQAEILYYSLFAIAFAAALADLSAPTWRRSIAVGLLFALAHFVKASALPALLLYLGSLALLCVTRLLRRDFSRRQALTPALHALLAAFAFLALLFPYLQESRERYGSHFYNVNTTFYIWYDSWAEAKAGTLAAGDREGYPDLPPEEIPTLEKYLREHTPQQILQRFLNGVNTLVAVGCAGWGNFANYGYCSQIGIGLLLLAAGLPLLLRRFSSREILGVGHVVFFVAAVFIAYVLGAAWYIPISSPSPRMILVLAAPFFWTLGLVAHSAPVQEWRLKIAGRSVSALHLAFGLLSMTLAYEVYQIVTVRAATMNGGY